MNVHLLQGIVFSYLTVYLWLADTVVVRSYPNENPWNMHLPVKEGFSAKGLHTRRFGFLPRNRSLIKTKSTQRDDETPLSNAQQLQIAFVTGNSMKVRRALNHCHCLCHAYSYP